MTTSRLLRDLFRLEAGTRHGATRAARPQTVMRRFEHIELLRSSAALSKFPHLDRGKWLYDNAHLFVMLPSGVGRRAAPAAHKGFKKITLPLSRPLAFQFIQLKQGNRVTSLAFAQFMTLAVLVQKYALSPPQISAKPALGNWR